jgi:hypothetical protein
MDACESAVMPFIEHPPCATRVSTESKKERMSHKCMRTYNLVQHDAVVPDPFYIAKGERIAVNVPIDTKKEGASISLVQIPLGLSA